MCRWGLGVTRNLLLHRPLTVVQLHMPMQRTNCQINVGNLAENPENWDDNQPTVYITIEDTGQTLKSCIERVLTLPLETERTGSTYRHQTSVDATNGTGIFAIANDITGEYLVEGHVPVPKIRELVAVGKQYAHKTGDEPFVVKFVCEHGTTYTVEQDILLTYSNENELLRSESLIPNDVPI